MKCNCPLEYKAKLHGLIHWWKYLQFRYKWRDYFTKSGFTKVSIDNKTIWIKDGFAYTDYPGPCMARDEYEHWFE